jgi:TRAP-type mannitol/chloroaromatic compound transport system permease small subunit
MMIKFCNMIDALSRFVADYIAWLFLPMTIIAVFEVTMRYLFNSPTTWAWDVNVQLFSLIVILGASCTYLNSGHVRMDIVVNLFSPRVQRFISLFLFALLIVIVGILAWQTGLFAWRSIILTERTSTLLSAPIYPLKVAIFLGVVLLWLQIASVFLRALLTLFSNEDNAR